MGGPLEVVGLPTLSIIGDPGIKGPTPTDHRESQRETITKPVPEIHPHDRGRPRASVFFERASVEIRPLDHHVTVDKEYGVGVSRDECQIPGTSETGLVFEHLRPVLSRDIGRTVAARTVDHDQVVDWNEGADGAQRLCERGGRLVSRDENVHRR